MLQATLVLLQTILIQNPRVVLLYFLEKSKSFQLFFIIRQYNKWRQAEQRQNREDSGQNEQRRCSEDELTLTKINNISMLGQFTE